MSNIDGDRFVSLSQNHFYRSFKIYAASNDMSMKDVLMAAFSALKEKSISGR